MRPNTIPHAMLCALDSERGMLAADARALNTWRPKIASELREMGLIETRYVLTEAGRRAIAMGAQADVDPGDLIVRPGQKLCGRYPLRAASTSLE